MATKQLIRNAIAVPGGVRIVYTTQEGRYLGEITALASAAGDINSAGALRAFAEDFRDFTEEEAAALAAADQPSPEIAQAVSRILTRQ